MTRRTKCWALADAAATTIRPPRPSQRPVWPAHTRTCPPHVAVSRSACCYLDFALEDVRLRDAGAVDFDAELRAQVGHGGGGSADDKEGREERGEGRGIQNLAFGIWDLMICSPLSPLPSPLSLFLQLPRQFPHRQISTVRLDRICYRPLQNDSCARVVGDFHQTGGESELVAERNGGFGDFEIWRFGDSFGFRISDFGFRFRPLAVDHTGDPANY